MIVLFGSKSFVLSMVEKNNYRIALLEVDVLIFGGPFKDCLLSGMVTPNEAWNLDLFCVWLSEDVVKQIFSRLNYGHSGWHTYSTSKGLNKATIQTDNLEVVRALPDGMLVDAKITVIRRVQRIMRTEGQRIIMYIPREINLVADGLAKLSLEWESRL
ncbi:hypothetical protein Gorai_016259 [Gossypium raimondii]|uniref:RNase H type-1 domain-containing protein n=1 Tax=Gossypium raimondii TaxID=29730 RepID=A0A7J8P888_GOSRA|nr:hypothetical protein [Gossypium raimondii]